MGNNFTMDVKTVKHSTGDRKTVYNSIIHDMSKHMPCDVNIDTDNNIVIMCKDKSTTFVSKLSSNTEVSTHYTTTNWLLACRMLYIACKSHK